MKLWIDDCRPAPEGWTWIRGSYGAMRMIRAFCDEIEIISLDHDCGIYADEGGDYIAVLKELERLTRVHKMDFSHIKFRLHSANPVGVANMRAIIEANGWKEIK